MRLGIFVKKAKQILCKHPGVEGLGHHQVKEKTQNLKFLKKENKKIAN
jgi:hypothetical protein